MSHKRHPNARAQYEQALTRKNLLWGSEWKYAQARKMRDNPTSAEAILWEWLRGNQAGLHFRRQAVIEGYIADFYCGLVRIAVEVDGSEHSTVLDRQRDEHLKRVGVATIRIPARRVYRETGTVFDDVRGQILGILTRDEWRRKRYLEHYKARWYWRKKNKNLAVWELYDKLASL